MKKHLFPNEGIFYKANLHCHSDLSDGALNPEQLKDLYKSNGYSVLAYTDHDIFIPHNELTDDGFVALNGFELQVNGSNKYPGVANEKKCHICFIANNQNIKKQPCYDKKYAYIGNTLKHRNEVVMDEETSAFTREYTPENINKIIKTAREKGFFITYNHPMWSMENYEQYMKYDGMHALEIFNNGTEVLGYNSYGDYIYDDMLRGGKKIFAVAADDNHNKEGVPDVFGGFVMIKAKNLTYEAITDALFKGNFYASTGPEIYDFYIEDHKLYICCSDAVKISLTTDRRISRCVRSEKFEALNEAVFNIDFECSYFRITIKDTNGNCAYTNAYFMEDI